jgi:serine/threonine protein kinase
MAVRDGIAYVLKVAIDDKSIEKHAEKAGDSFGDYKDKVYRAIHAERIFSDEYSARGGEHRLPVSLVVWEGHVDERIDGSTGRRTIGRPAVLIVGPAGEDLDILWGLLPLTERIDLMKQYAQIVRDSFKQGIAMRDLKPHNVLRIAGGKAVAIDFGGNVLVTNREGRPVSHSEMSYFPFTVPYSAPLERMDVMRYQTRGEGTMSQANFYGLISFYQLLGTFYDFVLENSYGKDTREKTGRLPRFIVKVDEVLRELDLAPAQDKAAHAIHRIIRRIKALERYEILKDASLREQTSGDPNYPHEMNGGYTLRKFEEFILLLDQLTRYGRESGGAVRK